MAIVKSVFGRVGDVVAALGDYSSSLVTNASAVTGATVTAALNTIGTTLASFNVALSAKLVSFNGRTTTAAMPAAGDYDTAQVNNSGVVLLGATLDDGLGLLLDAGGDVAVDPSGQSLVSAIQYLNLLRTSFVVSSLYRGKVLAVNAATGLLAMLPPWGDVVTTSGATWTAAIGTTIVVDTSGGSVTINLPAIPANGNGALICIKVLPPNALGGTLVPSGTDLIDNGGSTPFTAGAPRRLVAYAPASGVRRWLVI